VAISTGTFQCRLLTPEGEMLNCRSGSVILPGLNGHVGILRNHAPVVSELGLGIMHVKDIPDRDDAFYLIDGGFAKMVANYLTVLAYDVVSLQDMEKSAAQDVLAKAKTVVVGKAYIQTQGQDELDPTRARLLVKLGSLSSVELAD
jgi:F-type H+-transporting ATPase subunit epsilon